jgi:asparagine synthase (glutamine-hydrolysing)
MSGILGLIGEGSADELTAMAERMPTRGTLERLLRPGAGVLLGQCGWHSASMATVGVAVADAQLENADEIRALPGASVAGCDSDVELIAALVAAHGIEGLQRLRGCFAAALWDERARTFVLACDPMGFKATHYAVLPGRLAFASDYKALLALPDLVPMPDREAIQHYLATRTCDLERTFLAGVGRVTAGEALIWRDGRVTKQRYYQLDASPTPRSDADHASAVRDTLLRVVERQCRHRTRLGVTLSGGLDSAGLVAAIRRVRPEAKVATFTIGTGDDDPEILGARRAARVFATEHHETRFDPESIRLDLPRLIWLMEDCTAREEAILQLQILREAGRHVRIVLGGHGADAVFAGMPRYRLVRLASIVPIAAGPIAEAFQLTQAGVRPRSLGGRMAWHAMYRGRDYPPPRVLETSGPARVPWPRSLHEAMARGALHLADLNYLEPVHEAARLEFRTPFLDPDLVSLSLAAPERLHAGVRQQKILLRRALVGLLPAEIVRRPKAIQRVRHDARLSEILDDMAASLLDDATVRRRGLIDPAYLADLRRRPARSAYSTERLYRLWTLVSLEIWCRQFLDARGATPSEWRTWGAS